MIDEPTRTAAADLLEIIQPLGGTVRAMFGGYCFYVDGKVVGLVCDGRVFVKRSTRDDLLEELAELAPPYPGATDSWRLPPAAVAEAPDEVAAIIAQVAAVLPVRTKRR